jgi:murein DD-endopeptidase MepM/ murein hydrolase activator NlpD
MALLRPLRPVHRRFPRSQRWGVAHPRYSLGYHTGTDFAAPTGTRVRSPRTGRVTHSSYSGSDYGHYVIVKDWLGRKAFLVAHLSRRSVRAGQRVVRGQTLGYSGNTGLSTAPHLHAEQRHHPFGFRDNEKPGWE